MDRVKEVFKTGTAKSSSSVVPLGGSLTGRGLSVVRVIVVDREVFRVFCPLAVVCGVGD